MSLFYAPQPVVTLPPPAHPLDLADAKRFLRLEHTDQEDGDILDMIAAAAEYLTRAAESTLVHTTWISQLDAFPACNVIALPYPPVVQVQIEYFDGDGVTQVFNEDNYILRQTGQSLSTIVLDPSASWPATESRAAAVSISYTAGYGANADAMPERVRHAMRLLVRHFYDNRDAATPAGNKALEYSLQSLIGTFATGRVY